MASLLMSVGPTCNPRLNKFEHESLQLSDYKYTLEGAEVRGVPVAKLLVAVVRAIDAIIPDKKAEYTTWRFFGKHYEAGLELISKELRSELITASDSDAESDEDEDSESPPPAKRAAMDIERVTGLLYGLFVDFFQGLRKCDVMANDKGKLFVESLLKLVRLGDNSISVDHSTANKYTQMCGRSAQFVHKEQRSDYGTFKMVGDCQVKICNKVRLLVEVKEDGGGESGMGQLGIQMLLDTAETREPVYGLLLSMEKGFILQCVYHSGSGEGTSSAQPSGSGEGTSSAQPSGSGEGTSSAQPSGSGEGTSSVQPSGSGEGTSSAQPAAAQLSPRLVIRQIKQLDIAKKSGLLLYVNFLFFILHGRPMRVS